MSDQLKRSTEERLEVGETGDAQASLTPEVGTGTAQGQPVLPALTPDQVRQIQKQADSNVPCYGQLLTRILTSHETLRTELAQSQPYLKDGETVAQCIERNRKDIDATLTLLADARLQLDCERGVLVMTVARLGGIVEGRPTHRNNFLQRVDALREAEAKLAQVEQERDELRKRYEPAESVESGGTL